VRLSIVRSGLAESTHEVDVCAIDAEGAALLVSGDPDVPMYYRSAVKPFQATIALEAGLDVPDEHLAVVCASHSGWPEQLRIVDAVLTSVGLNEFDLQTPPAWPSAAGARDIQVRRGAKRPRSLWHNCSGKHAGMLAACVAAGWPTGRYLDPQQPLHRRFAEMIHSSSLVDPDPVGVDGCGAPAVRGTIRGLARAFSALTTEPRFARVAEVVARFPALVADNERADGLLGRWWGGPVKGGAEGTIAMARHGIGIAAKARSGSGQAAAAAAVLAADRLGMLSPTMREALDGVAAPDVFGGGRPVGAMQPA
jgi:L-asparaginase II